MKTWKFILVAILTIIILLFVSCQEQIEINPQGLSDTPEVSVEATQRNVGKVFPTGPVLWIEPSSYDFGKVKIGSTKHVRFVLRNIGCEALEIRDIQIKSLDEAFAVYTPIGFPFTIKPITHMKTDPVGPYIEEVIIEVSYAAHKREWNRTMMYIFTNDPENPVTGIYLEAIGWDDLTDTYSGLKGKQ